MLWWKLTVAYDGTDFAGWQIQPERQTVQGVMESVWQEITGEQTRLTASGRTDAGVHAAAQVVGVMTRSGLSACQLLSALNAKLPDGVAVLKVEPAPEGFHATHDAVRKLYRYSIHNSRVPPVMDRHMVWHVPKLLDADAMHRAGQRLVGRHDFSSFAAAKSRTDSMVRTIDAIEVSRGSGAKSERITVDVEGEGFLHNMVRIIVGTLGWVGQGSRPEAWVSEVLAARDRTAAGRTAPAQGLSLVRVDYGGEGIG